MDENRCCDHIFAREYRNARQLFSDYKIRRLPVVRDGLLVGIVTPGDIEKAMPSILDADSMDESEFLATNTIIETVMTASPITVAPNASLIEAVEKMRRNKIDGMPVVAEDRLVGIISITNILDAFLDIMTTKGAGSRFDLKIDHEPKSFYKMIKAFEHEEKEILAIFQHWDFSKDQQLITVLTRGSDNERLVDSLWEKEIKVDRITEIS